MTDAELRRDERDEAMLAKVKAGWWVQATWAKEGTWLLVLGEAEDGFDVWADGYTAADTDDITAIHPPTDDPKMETAYKLREPATVTRAEAANLLGKGGQADHWYWPAATTVTMPGGNVYEIVED